MPDQATFSVLIRGAIRSFRASWKTLVLTDIAFKIVALIALTPLVGILFRTFLATSGKHVVSDLDIVYFFLGPVGWVCAIVVGAVWLSIFALEQASLLGILGAHCVDKDLSLVGALQFAAANAWPVIRVTMRIIAWILVVAAPFLALAAVVYWALLTAYDINYYLTERPTVFLVAVGIGVVIALVLASILLRLFTGWFFALPLVLFEKVRPREALRLSSARTRGHRFVLLGWIVGWAVAMAVLSMLAAAAVGLIGRLITPDSTASLRLILVMVGVTLLLLAGSNLVVNLLSTTTLATLLFHLYREWNSDGSAEISAEEFTKERMSSPGYQLTRGRLLAAAIIGVLGAVTVGATAVQSVRLDDNVVIMAHRGASDAAPENTLAAFRKAIDEGANWIELDVQETADGEVVVMHDSDFMKLAGHDLKIWNASREDLKEIDIGSWFAPEFSEQRIPTLGEVLELCKGKIRVNIELKYYGHDEMLEQRVADIVDAHGMADEVMAMSLKLDGVKKMKSLRPEWEVGLLMSVSAGNLRAIEADFLAVNAGFATPQLIRAAQESGKKIYVWTVNDAVTMSAMISRGVDGLLTDKPALARSVLRQRAQLSAPERILLQLAALLGAPPNIAEQ